MQEKYKEAKLKSLTEHQYLRKDELVIGSAYAVNARNFEIAIWDGNEFQGLRSKFGERYMFGERHWDEGAPFGTVKPLYLLE